MITQDGKTTQLFQLLSEKHSCWILMVCPSTPHHITRHSLKTQVPNEVWILSLPSKIYILCVHCTLPYYNRQAESHCGFKIVTKYSASLSQCNFLTKTWVKTKGSNHAVITVTVDMPLWGSGNGDRNRGQQQTGLYQQLLWLWNLRFDGAGREISSMEERDGGDTLFWINCWVDFTGEVVAGTITGMSRE